jgi:predicted dehydrogenase
LSLKVGVIGVGYLGQHHARIYSEIKDAELVAVVDADRERADAFAEKYGCTAYSDFREIFSQVDALSIVTPTISHYFIALECLRAGKDILVEKPITGIVSEADELILESEKGGCILQVGHLERYNPAVHNAFELIKEPRFIESERLSPFLGRGTDVDVTVDLMIHDADIILSLVSSPVKEIKAVGAKVVTDKIDFAKAWLEFDNGCIAVLTASRVSPEKQRTLKVFQKDFYFSIDYQHCEIKRYHRTAEGMLSDSMKIDNKEPLREELEDFVRCVKERRRPKVSAVEGRDALKLVLDITETIRRKG